VGEEGYMNIEIQCLTTYVRTNEHEGKCRPYRPVHLLGVKQSRMIQNNEKTTFRELEMTWRPRLLLLLLLLL
jgi:hypothetical protein